jgi:hypothetical protein
MLAPGQRVVGLRRWDAIPLSAREIIRRQDVVMITVTPHGRALGRE